MQEVSLLICGLVIIFIGVSASDDAFNFDEGYLRFDIIQFIVSLILIVEGLLILPV